MLSQRSDVMFDAYDTIPLVLPFPYTLKAMSLHEGKEQGYLLLSMWVYKVHHGLTLDWTCQSNADYKIAIEDLERIPPWSAERRT